MTAKLDAIGSDTPEAALSRGASGDDPLATFQQEPHEVDNGSADSAALRFYSIPSQAPSVPFATPSVNDGEPRTAGVVNRIKSVLRALDIARDFEKTVDNRLAALKGLDLEVQDRAGRLEWLNQEIIVGAAHADDILRAIDTAVAALENRAQNVSTSLGDHVAAWEAREAAVVDAVEQIERRAADAIDDLEGSVGDCEARARIAEQTITRLDDVSSRTLPVIHERTKAAEEQNQSLERLITEAARMATSLTALEERLPAVDQCDQDLARIELVVPQIARQLEEFNASAEEQVRTLAVHQQRVRQTLDESQKTAAVVSELEGRVVALSGSHQQLDHLEKCVAQLEQRTAAAVGEATHAAHARNDLEQKLAVLQTQLRGMAKTAQGEATKLVELQRQAERYQQEHAKKTTAVVSGLEARLASGHQLLNRVEEQMGELEQRTTSAATELKHVADVRARLELEVIQLQNQLRPLTEASLSEVKRLTTAERTSSPSAADLLFTLRFRRRGANTSRGTSPARPIFGGAAFALSAAIVLLVSTVWRVSPVENQRPEEAPPAPVMASRALTLAPASAVAPPTRTAPAVPAVPVPLVVVSKAPVATRGGPTAAVRGQSVGKDAGTPRFVGTLLIESDPAGAAAFVNQKSVGYTPVLLKDLRAGSYVVRLEYGGYQRWSTAATVSAVRQERLKAKLEPSR